MGLVILGVLATLLIGFNFWFIDHSESALEDIVASQSKGKIKLKVEQFEFNWLSNRIRLQNALLYTTDSTAPTLTQLKTRLIDIKARGFLPLLFSKQILIDSIHIFDPKVIVTRINQAAPVQKTVDTLSAPGSNKFSVARELGKVANSVNDAIQALKINRFVLHNGSFSLIDKTEKNDIPFVVSNISIRLDNLQVNETVGKKIQQEISFTDDIAIRTTNQDMVFPGGRHFLSFKDFRFSLTDKRVEFDSCTVRGIKGDSSKTSFRIFFDKLALTNINFDTLYAAEVIQADSVFSTNPDIFLDIDGDVQTASDRKKIQNIDELVQQLLGDVMLNYVVVNNADINISTIKDGKANTFSSVNNNFELQGLMIRQNYERPVRVERLLMTLHHYETQLQNGRYAIAFDSVKFEDDAITLNDFAFKEYGAGGLVNNLKMPRFEVRGLSWESLLYDNVFQARSAYFYDPDISVTAAKQRAARPKSVFETLGDIRDILNLTDLGIQNGNVTLNLGKGATLELQETNLSLFADELTASKRIKNIQHSVKHLHVKKGIFKKGLTNATLTDIALIENNNGIRASALFLKDAGIDARAKDIRLNAIILDSADQTIAINGLTWGSGNVVIDNKPQAKNARRPGANNLALVNITGGPTGFKMHQGNKNISAFLNTISVAEIFKPASGALAINGLRVTGRDALMVSPGQRVAVAELSVSDNDNSVITDLSFSKLDEFDSIYVSIPQLTIIPDITQIAGGNVFFRNLVLTDPVINARLGKKDSATLAQQKPMPHITIGTALLQRPEIKLTLFNKNGQPSYVTWHGVKENSYIRLTDFESHNEKPIDAKQVDVFLTNFEYINAAGKKTATNDNKLNLQFDDLLVQKNDSDHIEWKTNASILSLDKLYFDSLGKKNAVLQLDKGDVRNITLNSKFMGSAMEILQNSNQLQLTGTNGEFTSALNKVNWYNLSFTNGYFSADSFSLRPLQSIDDYKIKKAFEQDYLTVKGGLITGGPFDLVKYSGDSILAIGGIEANNIRLLTFKDKRQEDTARREKPLPVAQILKIPAKIDIDSVRLKDMYVEYHEINPKTDTLGIVPVSGLNVLMRNIKNHNLQDNDSLYILATANVINELYTRLEMRESYTDSLGTFLMKLQTGPVDLKKFNEVLLPLEAIEVLDGWLDSLGLEAVGNNNYSTGQMRMYYKGLRLRLMNKNDFQKQGFANRLLSWVANTFIVRKNNSGKESPVFFIRLKDKSAINFLIKTSLSGIKSGVGLPGTKGKQRRYLRNIEKEKRNQQ